MALKRGFQILRGVALTNGMGGSEKEFQWLYMSGILTAYRYASQIHIDESFFDRAFTAFATLDDR